MWLGALLASATLATAALLACWPTALVPAPASSSFAGLQALDRLSGQLGDLLQQGALPVHDYARALLDRVEQVEPRVQAWTYLDAEHVLAQAAEADDRRRHGLPGGPLFGLPVGIKDIIDVAGMPTRAGSRSRRNVASTSGHGMLVAKVPMKGTRARGVTAIGSSMNGASPRRYGASSEGRYGTRGASSTFGESRIARDGRPSAASVFITEALASQYGAAGKVDES
jgi:aspartyl-tRNA(Asn)/glutamyl-tRNA(Gln) amidotransferase subunit A